MNIDSVKHVIENINKTIEYKNSLFRVFLDYKYNLHNPVTYSGNHITESIVLSLYKTDDSVSSIEFKHHNSDNSKIIIYSQTKESEENKKYNTFLLACSVIICDHWNYIFLHLDCEYPASLWGVIKYYKFNINENKFKKYINQQNIMKETISKYYEYYPNRSVEILLLLNIDNTQKAYGIIDNHIFL